MGTLIHATLPISAVNLESGWIDFPRPKTGIQRRVPLWPRRPSARAVIADRPEPKDKADAGLVFLTSRGARWVRTKESRKTPGTMVNLDGLSQAFSKLLKGLGINSHRNFYTLRHCFETYAGESKDQVAVDAIMGHVDPSMAATYRERISDERLRAAVDTVRQWLRPEETSK